jgi:metal-responsive CopG/Arc/MetJ family transcriptional regulator
VRLFSVYLPAELKQGLEALKARDGISASEAIRRALAEFLTRRKVSIDPSKGGQVRTRRK